MRKKAKKGLLPEEFLKPLDLTNDDLNSGLKLPLNAYSGALRAIFNALYDPLQGFSICTTGQCLILQLIHDLQKIPTLEMVSANTDAVAYTIEEEYQQQALVVLDYWQKLTGLELEEDKIVKIIMRDVNNYVELVQIDENDYKINYKGGEFRGKHIFKWDKEKKIFHYEFKDDLKNNSNTIVSEAILKKLLFNIPVEETINKCEDIFRFQIITHLGSTYEKMVQEGLLYSQEIAELTRKYIELDKKHDYISKSNDELSKYYKVERLNNEKNKILEEINRLKNISGKDIELQRNNRIYAGKKPSGLIVKVKPNGRRDSLAKCPPNPIVDNGNQCTIEDINKDWYIECAKQSVDDFLGIKRLEEYKKEELLELANDLGLDIDKKVKKIDIIEIIKNKKRNEVDKMATKQELEEKLVKSTEQNEKLVEKIKEMENKNMVKNCDCNDNVKSLNYKIMEFRKKVREREFIFDKELPSNLGGGEYYSIDQFYNAIQDICLEVGLDFSFETTEVLSFEKELVKPSGKLPIHVATVRTIATLTDIDTGLSKYYTTIAQGSDTIDKAISGASTLAFRQWFYKNFTPKNMNEEEIEHEEKVEKSNTPKIPVYVPEQKKEEIKKEVVKQEQHEESDDEDVKEICENIMKIREHIGDSEYGAKTLEKIMSGKLTTTDLLEIDLKIKNKMEKVGL